MWLFIGGIILGVIGGISAVWGWFVYQATHHPWM